MMSTPAPRRQFLCESASLVSAGVLASVAASAASEAPPRKGSAPLGLVVIGADAEMLKAFVTHPQARVTDLCQSSRAAFRKAARAAASRQYPPPRGGQDLARALASSDCAGVVIATTETSASAAVAAATAAGKPFVLATPAPVLLDTVDSRSQLFVPHRSYAGIRQAIAFLRQGSLGAVSGACILIEKPIEIDTARPSDEARQVARLLDFAFWGLGDPELSENLASREINALGQNVMARVMTAGGPIQVAVRPSSSPPVAGLRRGVVFKAEHGWLACPGDDSAIVIDAEGAFTRVFKGSGDPAGNFLQTLRGKATAHAPLTTCALSSVAWHRIVGDVR